MNQMEAMKIQKNIDLFKDRMVMPDKHYKTKIFSDIDKSKFKLYDKYQKLLESIIDHPCLTELKDEPLFLRPLTNSIFE
jgi:hypothetical protein